MKLKRFQQQNPVLPAQAGNTPWRPAWFRARGRRAQDLGKPPLPEKRFSQGTFVQSPRLGPGACGRCCGVSLCQMARRFMLRSVFLGGGRVVEVAETTLRGELWLLLLMVWFSVFPENQLATNQVLTGIWSPATLFCSGGDLWIPCPARSQQFARRERPCSCWFSHCGFVLFNAPKGYGCTARTPMLTKAASKTSVYMVSKSRVISTCAQKLHARKVA